MIDAQQKNPQNIIIYGTEQHYSSQRFIIEQLTNKSVKIDKWAFNIAFTLNEDPWLSMKYVK